MYTITFSYCDIDRMFYVRLKQADTILKEADFTDRQAAKSFYDKVTKG